MHIKPSAAIRKNYNGIAKLCKTSGEPVYLTKNGEGDLVVMDMDSYFRREALLRAWGTLLASEEDRQNGKPGFAIDEVTAQMKAAVREIANVGEGSRLET
jgi:PHD/YefM family antitoxin component YafN of YafNO toxin-antitoxin module